MNNDEITRRDFVSMTVAAGLPRRRGPTRRRSSRSSRPTSKSKPPTAPATRRLFIRPPVAHPGVLIWPDAFGLRPSMREIAKRLAAEGYSVLVPNPFYRVAKSPVFENASNFNFGDQAQRAKLTPLMGSINAAGAAERDAAAFIAGSTRRSRSIGTQKSRHAGLLHGRRARREDRSGRAEPRGRGRILPRRRTGDREPQQPASARAKDQGTDVFRHRRERRHAAAGREDEAEGSLRRGEGPRRSRGLFAGAAWVVRVRHADSSRTDSRSTAKRMRIAPGASCWRCTKPACSRRLVSLP